MMIFKNRLNTVSEIQGPVHRNLPSRTCPPKFAEPDGPDKRRGKARIDEDGFTLIEAMLSITILAMLAAPLFISQGSILRAVADYSLRLQRIIYAQNVMYDARNKATGQQKFKLEKKFDDPAMTVTYELQPVNKKTFAHIENILAERLTIDWEQAGKKQKEIMVSYLFKPTGAKKT